MASTVKKFMSIKVTLEGQENLALKIPHTRANIAKLAELGTVRVLKVRNPHGRKGAPKVAVKATRKPRAKKVAATA